MTAGMTMHHSASGVLDSAGHHAGWQDGPVRSVELQLTGQRLALLSPARIHLCGITPHDVTQPSPPGDWSAATG